MKFNQLTSVAALAGLAMASPTPTEDQKPNAIQKRASITEAANIGYASTNGGTTGGRGGTTTTVSSYAQFSQAVKADGASVVVVKGTISGSDKVRPSDDTTIVGLSGAALEGFGIYVRRVSNVIIRNLKISKVVGDDAVGIDESFNVWVDHMDLSSDLSHDKDYYDGLFDIKHGADWITLSNSVLHDHWKTSLIGHSDSNSGEDSGHLHVTYANNRWENLNSRCPSVRFGTVHIYNNYYNNIDSSAVNARMGAQVLVESTAFSNTEKALTSEYSDNVGYITANDVSLGGSTNDAPQGSINSGSIPYSYSLVGSGSAQSATSSSGNTLSF